MAVIPSQQKRVLCRVVPRDEVKRLAKVLDVTELIVADVVSPVRDAEAQAVSSAISETEKQAIRNDLLDDMAELADESLPGTPSRDSERLLMMTTPSWSSIERHIVGEPMLA